MKTLVLIGVLLIRGVAWADGWVIWLELTLSEKEHVPATTWSIMGAKETEHACQASLDESMVQWKKLREQGAEVTVNGYTVTVRRSSPPEAIEMYRYSCLPAGTDPRPR